MSQVVLFICFPLQADATEILNWKDAMLCRRMHLTERRIQPPRISTEGPIVRPCSERLREADRIEHELRARHLKNLAAKSR